MTGDVTPTEMMTVAAARALRDGDWKLVAAKGDAWELYNLAEDRSETNNAAAQHPQRVEELSAAWKAMETEFQRQLTQTAAAGSDR